MFKQNDPLTESAEKKLENIASFDQFFRTKFTCEVICLNWSANISWQRITTGSITRDLRSKIKAVTGTYFCCHTAACEKRSSMASKLIETLFIYSLASFYGLLASFAVLWQIIRRFEIPSRAKRRDTRKWINPILLSLILSEIVLRLIHSLLIGICQLESYYPSVLYTQCIFKCIWNVVDNEGYSFPFPSHLSTGAIPVIVAFFSWIISCYFDWVKRNIRLNLIEGTKTACNNLITYSCYIYLCYYYFREMSVDSHANLVRSKEPIIDQGYAITACCSL